MSKKLLVVRSNELYKELRRILMELDSVRESQVYLPNKAADSAQLLTLRVWCMRYKVDLVYVVKTLLQGKYRWARKIRTGSSTLGIPVTVLCGPASEKYLQEQIGKDFPGGQQKIDARQKLRRQLTGVRSVIQAVTLDTDDPDRFVSEYGKLMTARKAKANEVTSAKAWRGNPWR